MFEDTLVTISGSARKAAQLSALAEASAAACGRRGNGLMLEIGLPSRQEIRRNVSDGSSPKHSR